MNGWRHPNEVVQAAEWQRQFFAHQVAEGRRATDQHRATMAAAETEYQKAAHDLGVALLPSLHPAAIERAAGVAGYAPLLHERIPEKVEAQRRDIQQRLRAIEGDRRYQELELMLHPRTGTLTRKLAEVDGHLGACAHFLQQCQHPRLYRLLEAGYGTPAYKGGWWRLSSWRDDSAAKEIAARFPGKSFFELRAEYDRVMDAHKKLSLERQNVEAQIHNVKDLADTHERLRGELATLDDKWLAWARERVVGHMLGVDGAHMARWLDREPATKMLFLRASGAKAKAPYLEAVFQRDVASPMREWEQRVAKYAGMVQQYQRRPKPMPADKYQKMFPDRRQKTDAQWRRYQKTYGKVSGFNKYHVAAAAVGAGAVTYLWWDLMTDGSPGDYVPEVRHFREQHRDYHYEKPPKWEPPPDEGAVDDGVATDADAADALADDDGGGRLENDPRDPS